MYLIRTRQPSSSSFAMPPSRSLSSFPLLRGLKKMTRFISCLTAEPSWVSNSRVFIRGHRAVTLLAGSLVSILFSLSRRWHLEQDEGGRAGHCQLKSRAWGEGLCGMRMDECRGNRSAKIAFGIEGSCPIQPVVSRSLADIRNVFSEGRILSTSGQMVPIAKASQGQVLVLFRVHSKNVRSLTILADLCVCVHFNVCALESCLWD